MQEEFECVYDDFEIIRLDPNIDYVDSSDESEMECEEVEIDRELSEKVEQKSIGMSTDMMEVETCVVPENKPRKKLNLEEYKIRRANKPAPVLLENRNVLELCENIPDTLPILELPTDPRFMKNLMAQQQQSHNNNELEVNEPSAVDQVCQTTIHPDYEEIVLVSIECNTDISIPPLDCEDCDKSSGLLTNIVNSSSSAKTILNSSSSLLSSINAVLSEKRAVVPEESKTKSQAAEHGENKVIMHLRKDRLRPFRSNCEIQTEITPLFPPLILSPALIFSRIKNIRNFRRRSSRSSRSRSITPEPEYFNRRSDHYKYSRSVNSSSMNSSDSASESDTSAYSSCRSSDSIKRFDNRFNKQQNGYQRTNYAYKEERKIIYIGGLLEETTKDELRRKFLKYGTIKKISIHVKEDGSLRYGFVTFAESSAAYDVLDSFSKDPALCKFDLRFGGRRKFCKQTYADLDSLNQENEDIYNDTNNNNNNSNSSSRKTKPTELSFEDLLNMTKRKLCKK